MKRYRKHTFEEKLSACQDYLDGKSSGAEIVEELSLEKNGSQFYEWVRMYQTYGPEGLMHKPKNSSYPKEFKIKVVQEYLSGKFSLRELQEKYMIPSMGSIRSWLKKYNDHIELEDYNPHPEVYMAGTLKTTVEEHREMVEYCIENNNDYKGTCLKYGCSYRQIYAWVRKYKQDGDEGLNDKRGHHKKDDELTELEAAQRRAKKAEERIKRLELENEFLKKLNNIGRR